MKMGKKFIDTDARIESDYCRDFGMARTCREISLYHGESFFREKEQAAILTLKDERDCMIALGGGSLLCKENRAFIQDLGMLIFLDAAPEILMGRLLGKEPPVFIDAQDPKGSFERIYAARLPLYKECAHVHIDCREKTEQRILEELIQRIVNA